MASCILGTRLTGDGTLTLLVDDDLHEHVSAWMPRHLTLSTTASSKRRANVAVIRVRRRQVVRPKPMARRRRPERAAAVATFGPVTMRPTTHGLALDVSDGSVDGFIDFGALRADLEVGPARGAESDTVRAMLTVAAATLLGRLGRSLVHAAAVVAPDGGAWLLAGDSHAGKSTTCATLLDAGWRYCSDDHVVVGTSPLDELQVEGWPRTLHLDHGWDGGTPHGGLRASVDSFERWPGYWQLSARVMGVLLPAVHAGERTRLVPCTAAVRLAGLIRQSPWLFADSTAAPVVLALLRRVALLPGAVLRLGRDSFRKPATLEQALSRLTEAHAGGVAQA